MSDQPLVSVVVATAGRRPERLAALRSSIERQTFPGSAFEVIVVDDGGGSARRASLATPAAGSGPSVARNIGWRAARGRYVAFIDDDCVATDGWLEELVSAADGRDDVIVQGRTLPIPSERESFGPFSRSLWVESLGPWFQTCNVLYPRALLERVGGFDESAFPFVGEDADLAWRTLAGGGVTPVWAPGAQVFHAVNDLGPVGSLRVAWRWGDAVELLRRHPGLRREALTKGVFWKGSHYLLVRALIGLLLQALPASSGRGPLPRALRPVAAWLWAPYVVHLLDRGRIEGGGPLAAPWFVVHDLVETAGVARGAIRARTLVL